MQAALRDDVTPRGSAEALQILNSREHGASAALIQLARDIGLDRLLYSRSEPWLRSALAMIVGRLIYSGSKLSLSQLKPRSTLWEVCGIERVLDVDTHCYEPMDRLLERQDAIQGTDDPSRMALT